LFQKGSNGVGKEKKFHAKSGTKRSLFRLRLRLLHAMLDVILIVCLVIFAVAWLVSNDWDCLMSLWKNHALFLLCGSIYLVFSFDALFGLTWCMLTTCLTLTSRHKPLWSFGFWLLMPFYASLNDVLSLCMIMAVFALLVGRSSLLLALILYWVWALLVHPTPKNQVSQCVHYKFLCMVIASHSK
jgi:hypothetical protein